MPARAAPGTACRFGATVLRPGRRVAAAAELHAQTSGGQALWYPALVAEHLRAQNLMLRCTRDHVELAGEVAEQLALAIPGVGSGSLGKAIQKQAVDLGSTRHRAAIDAKRNLAQ